MFCHAVVVVCVLVQQITGPLDSGAESEPPVPVASEPAPKPEPEPAAPQAPRPAVWADLSTPHLFETRVSHEAFGPAVSDARVVDLSVNLRVAPRWRLTAEGQRQWKFGRTETRAGAGTAWQARRDVDLEVSALIGPANEILPTVEVATGVRWRRGRAELGGELRHLRFRFPEAAAWVATPGATVWLRDGWSVSARYAHRRTDLEGRGGVLANHSALVRTSLRVHRDVWVEVGGSSGVEAFDDYSPDRLGRYGARTLHTGARIALPWMTAVAVRSEYQRRSTGLTVLEISAGLTRGF